MGRVRYLERIQKLWARVDEIKQRATAAVAHAVEGSASLLAAFHAATKVRGWGSAEGVAKELVLRAERHAKEAGRALVDGTWQPGAKTEIEAMVAGIGEYVDRLFGQAVKTLSAVINAAIIRKIDENGWWIVQSLRQAGLVMDTAGLEVRVRAFRSALEEQISSDMTAAIQSALTGKDAIALGDSRRRGGHEVARGLLKQLFILLFMRLRASGAGQGSRRTIYKRKRTSSAVPKGSGPVKLTKAETKAFLEERYPQRPGQTAADYKAHIEERMRGIEFSKPIEDVPLKPGTQVDVWVVDEGPRGTWGTTPGTRSGLGIRMDPKTGLPAGRHLESYVVESDGMRALKSTAADFPVSRDYPTLGGFGGGDQYLLPPEFYSGARRIR